MRSKEFWKFWNDKWLGKKKNVGPSPFGLKVLDYLQKETGFTGGSILDLGCGGGRDSLYFLKNNYKTTSVDFSHNAIEVLKKFAGNNSEAEFFCSNYFDFDFGSECYDVIYACDSLHYFRKVEFQALVEKIILGLKKDGIFFMRVKDYTQNSMESWSEIQGNYFKKGEDYKYRFNLNELEVIFSKYGKVSVERVKNKHLLMNGDQIDQYYFELTLLKR